MKLFAVLLKLIENFHLVDSNEYAILKNDCHEWESTCTADNDNKLKALYFKLHGKSPLVRLLMPFAYFFMLKWVNDLTNPSSDLLDD